MPQQVSKAKINRPDLFSFQCSCRIPDARDWRQLQLRHQQVKYQPED